MVTRAAHQAEELAAPLRDLGAQVLLLPLIGIAPPLRPEELRKAAESAKDYDWIVFTSANAVEAFASEFRNHSTELGARVAAVGSATQEAAAQHGFGVAVTPEQYVAESLVHALGEQDLQGRRILLPRAAVARDLIPDELRRRGAQVHVVEAYRNVVPADAAERARDIFRDSLPHWILFASSSAVDNLCRLCSPEVLRNVRIGSIGPITSATITRHGLTVAAEAEPHTMGGLVKAVVASHMASCKQADDHPA